MSRRPLVLVSGLTVVDYLLWNWSLNANRDVLALVSGLTLPPLVIALVWLLAVTFARLVARSASRPVAADRTRPGDPGQLGQIPDTMEFPEVPEPTPPPAHAPASSSRRKIAA